MHIPGRVNAITSTVLPEEIPIGDINNNNDNLTTSYFGGESLVSLTQELVRRVPVS